MQTIRDSDWEKLRLAFEQRSLVLVVGPGVSTVETEAGPQPMAQALRDAILEKLPPELRPAEPADLSTTAEILASRGGRTALNGVLDPFFKRVFPINATQKALAALPFSIIINASPDKQICRALEKANVAYREEIHDFGRPYAFIFDPIDPRPFVFHLFGAVDQVDSATGQTRPTLNSVVVTGAEQLDFLQNIVQKTRKIPDSLVAELQSSKTFLFVGFDFDSWYLRLLLTSIGLSADKIKSPESWALHGGARPLEFGTGVFFQSNYQVNFLPTSLGDFAADLQARHAAYFSKKPKSASPAAPTIRAVILATAADAAWRTEFEVACAPLRRRFGLEFLELEAGDDRFETLAAQVETSQFVFPLITANFFDDEEFYDFLTEKIPLAEEAGRRIVSPILCSACAWKMLFQEPILTNVLPSTREFISRASDRAAAWASVAEEIERRIRTHFLG